ncbi:hypothetical protein B0H16DRAFT_1435391 [Mycena metata]|uniref:Uncharacterized protein n=1 Tax=Mycena metata TaxID=1033252 RepID=A0AAD7MF30_9AGAR|nr:hypothetical protein B0H16DRAFT_1435391 [Mycena metata]
MHWEDNFKSLVRTGNFRITRKVGAERIEYLPDLASVYPVFRKPTVIVIDLSDPKHETTDRSLDSLVRNADNDSWTWDGSGTGSSTAQVSIVFGNTTVECRRAPSKCRGIFACENIDTALLEVTRFELDPAPRTAILAAQAETRRHEGTTAEHNVAMLCAISNATPSIRKAINARGSSRGHGYFIGCSGYSRGFDSGHQITSIPDNVDEQMLAKSLAGQAISTDPGKDTPPCSKFVPGGTGLSQTHCRHPHIKNGVVVKSRIKQFKCPARRAIYVPIDRSIRKVLLVTNNTGHNHPMPILSKVSVGVKETYKGCVKAAGVVGATVAKVDNASSTKVLLSGKTPSAFAPGLHSKRAKRDIIAAAKREQFPHGLDAAVGVFSIYFNGLSKPLPERYIHGYITTEDGGICILTCVPYLLKLLDDPGVQAFDDDTTYKRILGKINEWEVTVYVKAVERAATVARAYINRGSADFFEKVFDELQRVKLMVTGKPIPLKRFVPGGNLLVMNADMDGGQILGICRSVMKHNVPNYSGIPNDAPPEQVAAEFIKICWRHAKEPVHDFRSLVSPADHARLLNFPYIESAEKLAEFSAFVDSLGIKKVHDWWAHKEMHAWIIPCLVKSQSRLSAEVWDTTPSTTNTNEAQHAWTNSLTGTGLSFAEGLTAAHEVDHNVADEIELSLKTGILANPHNESSHRLARNTTRHTTTSKKAHESQQQNDAAQVLRARLAEQLEERRKSNALSKELKEQLQALNTTGGRSGKQAAPPLLSASSSGRVKSVPVRAGNYYSFRAGVPSL